MGHLVIYQGNLARPHLSYIFNNEPYPTPSAYVLVRTVNKLSNKGPFQLMHSPTQHRRPKIPLFDLNAGPTSANCEQYLEQGSGNFFTYYPKIYLFTPT
jgi:hypothetical protein